MPDVPGLSAAIDEAADWATAAAMRDVGFRGSCAAGEFVGSVPVTPPPVPLEYDVGEWGLQMYSTWRDAVEKAFESYSDMPDPETLVGPAQRVADGALGLSPGGATTALGGASDLDVGNSDLSSYVEDIQTSLGNLHADTIANLRTGYTNRLDDVLNGQHLLGCVVVLAVAGEGEVWRRSREDVVTIARTAARAFRARAEAADDMSELGVALSVGGTAVGIGGLATGPFAVVTTVLGASMAIAGALISAAPPPPEPPPMSGGSADEIHGNLTQTLYDLGTAITQEEDALAAGVTAAHDQVLDSIDYFDLGTPSEFLEVDDTGALVADGEELALVFSAMRQSAARLEAIKNMVTSVTGDLSGALSAHPWSRPAGVGYSRIGHYAETAALLSLVCNVATRTASTCGELAEQLLSATHDFEGTEEAVDEELARLVQDLADPSGRTDVRYGYDDRNASEPAGIGGAVRGEDDGG